MAGNEEGHIKYDFNNFQRLPCRPAATVRLTDIQKTATKTRHGVLVSMPCSWGHLEVSSCLTLYRKWTTKNNACNPIYKTGESTAIKTVNKHKTKVTAIASESHSKYCTSLRYTWFHKASKTGVHHSWESTILTQQQLIFVWWQNSHNHCRIGARIACIVNTCSTNAVLHDN